MTNTGKPRGYRHGMWGTRFYRIWRGIFNRCKYPSDGVEKNYTGRGITISDRWLNFKNFYDDMYASYQEHVSNYGEKNTTIERSNNNFGYYKSNTRWATRKEQGRNKRNNRLYTYKGKTRCLSEWCERFEIPFKLADGRLRVLHWDFEKALTAAPQKVKRGE